MRNYRKWTMEEDSTLLAQVKANPQNLTVAFTNTAELTNRSVSSCSYRWYSVISKREDKESTAFMCISKTMMGRNRKNLKTDIPEHSNSSLWSKIIKFFFK